MMNSFFLMILTLAFSTSLLAAPKGSFKLLTHEEYVHLSDNQKNDYHIMIMELMVELESQYKTETKTYGFSPSRLEKFKKAVSQLQNIFISSAYANPVPSQRNLGAQWNKFAQDFASLSTRPLIDGGNCVFAGWISRVRRGNCIHPMAREFNPGNGDVSRQTEEFKSYPRDPAKGCNAEQMKGQYIQCNPLIFGYRKKSEGKLFCVPSDNLAENSSYRCMTAALETVPAGNSQTDSTEVRLADLRTRYSQPQNANAFNAVFMFNFKTCICPTAPNDAYNKDYQNHIRPDISNPASSGKYQACYGMIKMMDRTLIQCDPPAGMAISQETRSIFESFRRFTSSNRGSMSGSDASKNYASFLRGELQTGDTKTAYQNLCSITRPVDPDEGDDDEQAVPECKIACVAKEGAAADSDTRKSNAVLSCEVSEVKIPLGANKTMTPVAGLKVSSLEAPAEIPAEGQAPAIGIKFTGTNAPNELSASCSATYPKPTTTPVAATTCAATCTHTVGKPAAGETPAVPEKFECTAVVTIGDQTIPATVPAVTTKATSIEVIYTKPGTAADAGTGQSEKMACEAKWSETGSGGVRTPDPDPGKPTLSLTGTPDGAKVKIKAEPKNASGWELKFKLEPADAATLKGTNQMVTDKNEAVEFIQDKGEKAYKVCAELVKTAETAVSGGCVDIAKLGDPDAPAGGKPPIKANPITVPKLTPPQAPFMRNGSDTSARGIK